MTQVRLPRMYPIAGNEEQWLTRGPVGFAGGAAATGQQWGGAFLPDGGRGAAARALQRDTGIRPD